MDESAPSKPSPAYLACAVLVLAACIFLISVGLAGFADTQNPYSVGGGIVMLPLPTALLVQQYRAAFRRNGRAAKVSAVLLWIVAGFAAFALLTTLGELVLKGMVWRRQAWEPLAIIFTIAAGCGLAGWLNLRWSRQLGLMVPSPADVAESSRFSVRELLALVTMIYCMTALVTHFVRSTPPKYAEHVSREEAPFGLPPNASDVSFCQGFRGTKAYEFTIDEADFVAWVESGIGFPQSSTSGVTLQPIIMPIGIHRYYLLSSELDGPDSITISNGLFYEWTKEDRGVHAAFDRSTNRAYFYAHYH